MEVQEPYIHNDIARVFPHFHQENAKLGCNYSSSPAHYFSQIFLFPDAV